MTSMVRDPLQQHMLAYLDPRRGSLPANVAETIAGNLHAGNITFLIKYTVGPKILASQISITVVDVRGHNNSEVGHKATVCIHYGPVKWGQNVVQALGEKVDKAVREILKNEGDDGYGDFKD
ncbi:hypothetical protein J4E90_002145 [Alternaria incomplexa]|uniref:uncharacterized protein n=1 Tax=Alternaria incomplexa TaxID=1187928 RepID=UPI00221E5166|nr:uncharacterized protein J4E90_002145 [Alternaria incomplexa]KAI4920005.1 hypothetical protein J4E90_002145 [Alternaria incomplexa]